MPANKKATIRYYVIDKCLRDKSRIWHWEDLQAAIATHLRDFQGEDLLPSKRTILGDLQAMRSGELGYIAPIIHTKSEGYRYAEPGFSIYKSMVPAALAEVMHEVFALVKQSLGNSNHQLLQALNRLSEYIHVQIDADYTPVIQLEHSLNDPGYRWLDTFYHLVKNRKVVRIGYAPFEGPEAEHVLSPWFIREYNNRWYIYGHHHESGNMYNLALDRVQSVNESLRPYVPCDHGYVQQLFRYLYGVTIPENAVPMKFTFRTTLLLGKYMETKPLHPTQLKHGYQGGRAIFSVTVYDNYEIRSKFRSFGDDLEVTEVREIRKKEKDESAEGGNT